MKKLPFTLIFITSILFLCCKKREDSYSIIVSSSPITATPNKHNVILIDKPLDSIKYFLYGKWKLVKMYGGIAPTTIYFNDVFLEFKKNDTAVVTKNNIVNTVQCMWLKQDSIYGVNSTFLLKVVKYSSIYKIVNKIQNDTLQLIDFASDAYTHYLIRQ
jgi:hypothetical protein